MRRLTCAALVGAMLLAGCGDDSEPAPRDFSGVPPEHIERVVEQFNLGVALMERYQPKPAADAFGEVVRLAPRWTTARVNYGIALLNMDERATYPLAEAELNRAIEQDPDNPYAHYALGMLLQHLVRFEEARAQFREVLRIDPEDPDAHCQLGTLLMDDDPVAAAGHLEKALAGIPHHEAACYRLFTLMRDLGQDERARTYLERFQLLKSTGAGRPSGMKYGEMGRYGDVVRAFGEPRVGEEEPVPPTYADVALDAGLIHPSDGEAGWPGSVPEAGAAAFGPALAVTDVDGDGDLDIYRTLVGPEGAGNLYLGENGAFRRFKPSAASGIDGRGAIGAFFGDYDGDGDPDLFLTCAGENRLYRNEGAGRFVDATESAGVGGDALLSVGAAWADADHDGDLDLYVANYAAWPPTASGAPNALWRNDGDGSFTDVSREAGVSGGEARTAGVLFFDADEDRDADLYLVNDGAPNRLFLNDRVGRYTELPLGDSPLGDGGPGVGAVLGDVDGNGREDVLLVTGTGSAPPRLLLQVGRGTFIEDAGFTAAAGPERGAAGALVGDLDLDGDLDVVLLDAEGDGGTGHRIVMNRGAGRFAPAVLLGEEHEAPRSRGALATDLDGDGMLDLLVGRAGERAELWRAPAPEGRHWLEVEPSEGNAEEGFTLAATAVGLQAEIKAGQRLQVASLPSASGYLGAPPPRLHFGLGDKGKADYVRIVWADGVLQSEMEVAADQLWRVAKVERKPSSCPILFTWDGARFRFITDFLGVGGCGFFIEPGLYAPPDPTEDVLIPPGALVPRDGRLLLRIAEPLEEVSYFDQMHLVAYDHPAAWELHPDERFTGSPPFPTGEPVAVAERIPPVAAVTDRGHDVLDLLRDVDRRYVEPPVDPRFVGFAADHWLELDFGDRLGGLPADARVVLHLHGWVEYTYSHVNYAAYQAGISMRSPYLEVPDGDGGWRTAIAEIGFPAGLPRVMTVDLSDVVRGGGARFRIRSNMEVFWDQAWIGVDVADDRIRRHVLPPEMAELRMLGYPREFSPDGGHPTIYDYHRLDGGVPFRNMAGDLTRLGDVRELLRDVDDRFVIMGRGEEVAMSFDATALPPLEDGWARTYVLHADGYCKDMDLYTAFPDTIGPLPYHGMENYPPAAPRPPDPAYDAYRAEWNTRHIPRR